VVNNGSETFNLVLSPPYDLVVEDIPPGEERYLNFTADMPTAGAACFCGIDDHRDKGLEAILVVTEQAEGEAYETDEGAASWLFGAIMAAGVLVSLATFYIAFRPPPARPEEHARGEDGGGAGAKGDGPSEGRG
jgi:hypothetical protein